MIDDNRSMDGLSALRRVDGLTDEDHGMLCRLLDVYTDRLARNRELMAFYEDKNPVTYMGLAVPNDKARRIGARTGWAAKAVDYLAARSIFDGFTTNDDETADTLAQIMADNDITAEYAKGVTPELVIGCGFWTLSKGAKGEQPVVINYHNALSSAALRDYRHKRILAGLVIEDYELTKSGTLVPCEVVMHTSTHVITFKKDGKSWTFDAVAHPMGRPMMEAMCYRPTDVKFGKSRISPAVQDIVKEAQREIVRMAFSSEVASQPLRYMLGASEEAFDMDKFSLAYNTFLTATKDEDGDLPQLGQLEGASPVPHISIMEHLMSRMSGETGIPVSSFGLSSNGYTSSDALRASSDDLILEAESLNRTNGEALRNVALMALAVSGGKSYAEVKSSDVSVNVHWKNPSMPSIAAQSDAMVKQAGVVEWLPESGVFWEQLGYSEEERMRLMADRRRALGRTTVNEVLEVARYGRP